MAEAILEQVHATSMFDLRGVVAVVTGGGTVSTIHHAEVSSLVIRHDIRELG